MSLRDNPIMYLYRQMWKYSKGNRNTVLVFSIMFVISNIIWLSEPLIVGKILNTVQEEGVSAGNMWSLIFLVSLFFVSGIGFWSFHGPARVMEMKNSFKVRANYKRYLLEGTMDLPAEWHADHHSGDTIDRIEKGAQALYSFSGNSWVIISTLSRMVLSYIALIYFNIHAAYIVFFSVAIIVSAIVRFDRMLAGYYKELNRSENRVSEKVYDAISNITTIIILRVEKLVSSAIYRKITEPFGLYSKNQKLVEMKWGFTSTAARIMIVLVMGSYIFSQVHAGEVILAGSLYVLYGYVEKISGLFSNIAGTYGEIVRQQAAMTNSEELAESFQNRKKVKAVELGSQWRALYVNDLSFSYHTQEGADLHLDNISITIKKGERVALIGASGSGKTTLLKIIRDLYHPTRASILLDGKVLPQGFKSISEDIALIPQDPEIFSTTILENITLGVPHTKDSIKKFTNMACFSDVVERLPHKLDSSIFEKGVNLSGGEKQRLALARGLMACEDKEIILLDEPTSSVDTRNELTIYQNIFKAFQGKTVVSSIHRLHLLPIFDTIHFFRAGKIIASGTFQQLLADSPEFQDLWTKYSKLREGDHSSEKETA